MRTASAWNFRSIGGKIVVGLVLAAMIGSINVAPALGKDKGRKHDNSRYEQRGRGNDRGHYVYERGRRVYRPYTNYRARVYVQPPVIYEPPPPPGISIFLPSIVINPWGY
ncbi:MAG: hypothetical protein M0P74_12160 [Syntrophales bacterium]|jgi:hypothetical protein|nr:hypothetical protein [Syntrophales bacterium]